MPRGQNFGKRKFGGSHSNSSEYFMSPKNQRRPCREIIYTEDHIPVRKLYFCVATADITKSVLRKHFALFGRIEHFILHLKLSYCYGFIQYKSVHSAAAALRNQQHYVGGFKIKVSVADSWHQPLTTTNNGIQMEPAINGNLQPDEHSKQFHIFGLNDDCLFHIFDMLNCMDLSAVDQTCLRFQWVAADVFRKKHTAINLTMTDLNDWSNVGVSELTLLKVRSLIVSYGAQIQKLQVAAVSFKPENRYRVLDLIIRNCTALKTICLTGFFMKESLYRVSTSFFAGLEELSFNLCEISDSIRQVFQMCGQLRKLTIQSDSHLTGSCLTIPFPNLESITLIMNSDIETRHIYTFFKHNSQLKSVKIVHCGGCIFDEIFPHIATRLRALESLTIEVDYFQNFSENIMFLLRLEHLRELQLNCSMYSIAPFIEELAVKDKIQLLHLSDGLLNDSLIDAIVKCKKLTSLKLCSMPSVHNRFLVELARNLPELDDFHISKCQTLTASGVIQFAELASKLKTLHISNSSVGIDNAFVQNLAAIYKQRGTQLKLSLNKMLPNVESEIRKENRRYVEITNEFFLNDVYEDELSLNDSDDDDDEVSDDESWNGYEGFENIDEDLQDRINYNLNMLNIILY